MSPIQRAFRSTWLRRALWGLSSLLGLLVLVVTSLLLWIDTSAGRGFAARRAEEMVGERITGSMRIGSIDRIAHDVILARDVRFYSPSGAEVIVAQEVELDLRLLDAVGGRIATEYGIVRGGTVFLEPDSNGELGIDRAFRVPPDSEAGGGGTIDLANLHVSAVEIKVRSGGMPSTRVTRVSGVTRLWTPMPGAQARLHATNLAGRVEMDTPVPIVLNLTGGSLSYDGARVELARLDVRGKTGGSPMRLEATVSNPAEGARISAELTVDGTAGWMRSSPLILQGTLADLATSAFDLRVRSSP